jgi:hypothetical protein
VESQSQPLPIALQLGRELDGAGWTVSDTAGEMGNTGFGVHEETVIRKAAVQAIKAAKLWAFDCLELTEVTMKSLLGLSFLKIAIRGKYIQVSPCFENVGEPPMTLFYLHRDAGTELEVKWTEAD